MIDQPRLPFAHPGTWVKYPGTWVKKKKLREEKKLLGLEGKVKRAREEHEWGGK